MLYAPKVIDVLEAQEIKETVNEKSYHYCRFELHDLGTSVVGSFIRVLCG
jgi:hypothetical protein